MTDPDESAHSQHYRATGDSVHYRDPDEVDSDDEMFEVRMPIASTGEVRNEGDDPLTRDELDGMARQLAQREIGVFPSHGGDDLVTGGRYSQLEKLGVWEDATVQERDAADVLMATARMPDPETLPAATGEYRQALAILKEQGKRGIPMDASIGWREDEDAPGGNDLMEASIVGIGADPITNTGDEAAAVVARAAVDAGVDPDALVENVERAVRDTSEDADADSEHESMTDDDAGDEAGTTDDEQDAPDEGDETERDDAECPECGYAIRDDANFCSECGEDLREDDEDGDDEEEEEDEDDEEQSADPEADEGEEGDDERDLASEVAELREELDDLRSGDMGAEDVETNATESEQDEDRDADDEQTDNDGEGDTAEIRVSDL